MIDKSQLSYSLSEQEDRLSRGFFILTLTAFYQEKKVGDLKMTWIPAADYQNLYPSIYHFLKLINGVSLSPEGSTKELWLSLRDRFRSGSHHWGTDPESLSSEEIVKDLERMTNLYQKSYRAFEGYQKDRPYVYYIEVEKEFRRSGLATELYLKMAKVLEERGLRLHSASTQSEDAKQIWISLEAKGIAKKIKIPANDEDCYVIDLGFLLSHEKSDLMYKKMI